MCAYLMHVLVVILFSFPDACLLRYKSLNCWWIVSSPTLMTGKLLVKPVDERSSSEPNTLLSRCL